MNKFLHTFIISALLVLPRPAHADENSIPRVTVYGTATTEVVPDQMIWWLRVETRGRALDAVAGDHAKSVEKLLAFLKESKVDPKALQTAQMQFSENWDYASNSRILNGYIASTEVSFKTTDFAGYGALWLGLAQMPAVSVQNVDYNHTKRIEFQNQTREKAILAAKEKAMVSAKALGVEIGAPLLLEEDVGFAEYNQILGRDNNLRNVINTASIGDGGQEAQSSLAPGMIPIRVRVKASFQLLSRK